MVEEYFGIENQKKKKKKLKSKKKNSTSKCGRKNSRKTKE